MSDVKRPFQPSLPNDEHEVQAQKKSHEPCTKPNDNTYQWHFAGLAAHQLLPLLSDILIEALIEGEPDSAQLCWLENNAHPVIGLLPRSSWTLYPINNNDRNRNNDAKNNDVKNNDVKNNEELSKVADTKCTNFKVIQKNRDHYNSTNIHDSSDSIVECSLMPHYKVTHNVANFEQWLAQLIDYMALYQASTRPKYQKVKSVTAFEPSSTFEPIDISETSSAVQHYYHGLMGFVGYDIAAQHLSPHHGIALASQPSAYLGHYDLYLTPCHFGWQLHYQSDTPQSLVDQLTKVLTQLDNRLNQQLDSASTPAPKIPLLLSSQWQYHQYQAAFNQVQQHLYQGNSYQINLTQPWQGVLPTTRSRSAFKASFKDDSSLPSTYNHSTLLDYLPVLHDNTNAPFAGYLQLNDFELLSCSPELFYVFEKTDQGDTLIRTKPIKGTRPRGQTESEDEQLKADLATSEKDRSENVMIVDLLRNDLGKYAQTGSVKVPKLFAIESFSNVHHMVSTITATIEPDVHPLTVLFDSLPAGSITGTPKRSAIEIISDLEVGPRGAYCGTMGYMNFDGSGQWNVLIRTLQANLKGEVKLWAGGGITIASDCEAEYQECLDKVGNLLAVLAKDNYQG
ncbi:MAG: anthranilate synthase component I family protein [Psychrobacter sp.]|nr:anthranilate synthase component I family protein [Psychrobacter sp.]